MILLVVLAGLLFVGLPGLAPGRRGHPMHVARLGVGVQLLGFVLTEAGLVLWATPTLLDIVGAADLALVCRRLLGDLLPGGRLVGLAAATAAAGLAVLGVRGAWNTFDAQRRLRVEAWLGTHERRSSYDLVVLPDQELAAYTVGGKRPQVVITVGLLEEAGVAGSEAVCAHEAVHARRRHHRYLVLMDALSAAFGWYPLARRGVWTVRLALERWADEEASDSIAGGRDDMRRALSAVITAQIGLEVVAFGYPNTIAERVRGLSRPAPPRSSATWVAVYGFAGLAATSTFAALGWVSTATILTLAGPGLCMV